MLCDVAMCVAVVEKLMSLLRCHSCVVDDDDNAPVRLSHRDDKVRMLPSLKWVLTAFLCVLRARLV
jgi:hypothetical protein